MTQTHEEFRVGSDQLLTLKRGSGTPMLVLREGLGHPGWQAWLDRLSRHRTLLVPLHLGFGQTPWREGPQSDITPETVGSNAQFERDAIAKAFIRTRGNKVYPACLLKISRKLYERIERCGLATAGYAKRWQLATQVNRTAHFSRILCRRYPGKSHYA